MAGHSKWAQIKHKKAITDAKKGRLFSKVIREIMVAARSGAPDPQSNPRLRTALERARAIGLPKDTMERAIERASGEPDAAGLQEFVYEATYKGGVMLVIEGISDNTNRSLAEIRKVLNDRGGKLADPGSVLWNFEKIGVLRLSDKSMGDKPAEEVELVVIEARVKDYLHEESEWVLETEFTQCEKVRRALENQKIVVEESGHAYKPLMTVTLDTLASRVLADLVEALLELDDVQDVYTNVDASES